MKFFMVNKLFTVLHNLVGNITRSAIITTKTNKRKNRNLKRGGKVENSLFLKQNSGQVLFFEVYQNLLHNEKCQSIVAKYKFQSKKTLTRKKLLQTRRLHVIHSNFITSVFIRNQSFKVCLVFVPTFVTK